MYFIFHLSPVRIQCECRQSLFAFILSHHNNNKSIIVSVFITHRRPPQTSCLHRLKCIVAIKQTFCGHLEQNVSIASIEHPNFIDFHWYSWSTYIADNADSTVIWYFSFSFLRANISSNKNSLFTFIAFYSILCIQSIGRFFYYHTDAFLIHKQIQVITKKTTHDRRRKYFTNCLEKYCRWFCCSRRHIHT